ncbi:MAG: GNAT family N-acetyltransferase [Desulfobacterium sp.]|nr:GNAT family N-acetyltransferase [Desulfobacterium sp.]
MSRIIGQGVIDERRVNTPRQPRRFRMQLLEDHYLDEVMALQAVIVDRLTRKEMLEPFSKTFMQSHFDKKGFVIGIFVNNRLIAFRNVYFPDKDDLEWNLGLDLGFSESECKRLANLQMVCVHPDFRGNHLARKMNRQAIDIIRKNKNIAHLLATVSPYNYWNVDILLNSGFVICALKEKYRGKLRYIVYQNLTTPVETPPRALKDKTHAVALTDFKKQEELLETGFYGFELREIPDDDDPLTEHENNRSKARGTPLKNHELLFSKFFINLYKNHSQS